MIERLSLNIEVFEMCIFNNRLTMIQNVNNASMVCMVKNNRPLLNVSLCLVKTVCRII